MTDDLRRHGYVTVPREEYEGLQRWKAEAVEVLDGWDQVADAIERVRPCPLGALRFRHALKFVQDITGADDD